MYCNICSKIVKKNHFKTKTHKKSNKIVTDILLDVVGGEMGLVKQILDYKQDMEYQVKTIKMDRFKSFKNFANIKEYKLTNRFNEKLKFSFKKNHCYLKLDEVISLEELTYNQEQFLETLDLALIKFYHKGKKTNKRLGECINKQIKTWNKCHFDSESETLLFSRHNEINL